MGHYYLRSLSRTSRTFSFPDPWDILTCCLGFEDVYFFSFNGASALLIPESAKRYPCGVDCAIVAALYMRIMRTCVCTGCVAGEVVGAGARAGAVVGPRAFAVAVAGLRARVRLLVPARLRLRLGVRAGAVVGARAVAVAVAGLRARARLLVPVRLRLRWRLLLRLRARVRWLVPARLRCARTRCHCPGIAVAPWNLYYCVACSLRLQ